MSCQVDNFPLRYTKSPCLLLNVRWSPRYTSNDDSWEPYVLLKNVNALRDWSLTNNEDFKTCVLSLEYAKLSQQCPNNISCLHMMSTISS